MIFAERRNQLILWGAVAALAAGGLLALALLRGRGGEPATPPPASQGGLVIDASGKGVGRIDPARPLRCFVDGQFVGELTFSACAQRNGVATEALDMGVDATGAVTASAQPAPMVTGAPVAPPAPSAAAPAQLAPHAGPAAAACWTHAEGQWRRLPSDTSLSGCVQALFAGRCVHPGEAVYGRWGQQTLRLVPGRVEVSDDNRSFRPLVRQGPGCSLAAG
jgi:hypothetical protein